MRLHIKYCPKNVYFPFYLISVPYHIQSKAYMVMWQMEQIVRELDELPSKIIVNFTILPITKMVEATTKEIGYKNNLTGLLLSNGEIFKLPKNIMVDDNLSSDSEVTLKYI